MRTNEECFGDLSESHRRGQATESIIKAAFVKRGYSVLVPAYDNEQYDFVVDEERFWRFQAKTARKRNSGTIQFETVSTKARSDGYVRSDYAGAIDYFAVFNPIVDAIYLIHVDEAAKGKMELRVEPPANNQTAGINWHEEYEIDAVLSEGLERIAAE